MRRFHILLLAVLLSFFCGTFYTLQGKFGRTSATEAAPPPLPEPNLVVDSFTRETGYPCIRARLENHSTDPIFHVSTFGRPILWAYYSRDGVHWEGPSTTSPGCGVGYYVASLNPDESSPSRGCNLTPLYNPWPRFVKFGVAWFDRPENQWNEGRVLWSRLYRVEDDRDPTPVPWPSLPTTFTPVWPTVVACRRDDLLRDENRVRVAVTFESAHAGVVVPNRILPRFVSGFSLRYRRADGGESISTHELLDPSPWLDWRKRADGRFELHFAQVFDVSSGAVPLAVGVPFQATKNEAVIFKRIWANLTESPKPSR